VQGLTDSTRRDGIVEYGTEVHAAGTHATLPTSNRGVWKAETESPIHCNTLYSDHCRHPQKNGKHTVAIRLAHI